MAANGPSRKEMFDEFSAMRKESNLQYAAIAEFMGRMDACIDGHTRRLDVHRDNIDDLNRRLSTLDLLGKVWSGINTIIGAVAVGLWGSRQ